MTTAMTIDDLLGILKDCAGEGENLEPAASLHDTTFDEMGYDSLAVIEAAARIEQDYGIAIPDDDIADLRTPRALLTAVNESIAEPA
jgi:act minimal PKS acyl carrier protein